MHPEKGDIMNDSAQQTAIRLTWAGVVPFIVSAAMGAIGVYAEFALQAFMVYSAVILSFLGGIHWGLAMRDGISKVQGRLVICMVPSLVAWVALSFLPALIALVVLAFFFIIWLRYDTQAVTDDWYVKLRKPLTFVVAGTHFLWFISLASQRAVL